MLAFLNRFVRRPAQPDPGGAGRGGVAVATDKANLVPEPLEALAPHVVYLRVFGPRFEQTAVDLNLPSTGQAQALRQRAAGQGGYVEYLAPTFGLSSEQVQHVLAAQGFVVHVDAHHYGTPCFLARGAALRRLGATLQVGKTSAQDLAALCRELASAGRSDDTNLQTPAKACQLIADAAAIGASDIHILVREDHIEVQIRIKGDLRTVALMSIRHEEGERLMCSMYPDSAAIKEDSYKVLNFQNTQITGEALPGTGLTSVRIIQGPSFPVESGGGFLIARLQYRDLAA